MADCALKTQLLNDMKQAMRDQKKELLGTIRLALSAIKQKEVDERVELSDAEVTSIIEKMIKQRRESIKQFEAGARPDLAAIEVSEIDVLKHYMPQALSEAEVEAFIRQAIQETDAKSAQDMGKVMTWLKAKVQGRTDMGLLSAHIKKLLV
ncbi:MAG: GatB/YqeY domain-containing protein [Gammaproteobacteria bacterium]|nr:GatB/YqeY domain-containing protein [Gammaproteobacteria bacterium]